MMLPLARASYGSEHPTRSQQDPRRKVLFSSERRRKRDREPTGIAYTIEPTVSGEPPRKVAMRDIQSPSVKRPHSLDPGAAPHRQSVKHDE
jgi:hypothetical protein